MEIKLPLHLQNYADSLIATGAFENIDQLISTAIENLKGDAQGEQELQRLRNEIEDCLTDHPDNNTCVSLEEWKLHTQKIIAAYGAQTRDNS